MVSSPRDVITQLSDAGLESFAPGDSGYAESTSPENSSVAQEPACVVRPRSGAEVAAAVRIAHDAGLGVAVQATGHGAGHPLDDDVLLIDTSGLADITIDVAARTATVGAGAVWGDVQRAAFDHGLLGLAGTSPSVGVAGYTFGGGVGWLTRRDGLASAALREVVHVDAEGSLRTASDESDPDAIWAFRGGQSVGVAVSLTFDLVEVDDLWARYLLWPVAAADAVVEAWSAALAALPSSVTSTIALLRLPPEGPFPDDLLGTTVVHLSLASTDGPEVCSPLLERVRAAVEPVVDTTGPADPAVLGGIHLDPPPGNPALGEGRWLDAGARGAVGDVLAAAHVGLDGGLMMVELRHVASTAPVARDGALVAVPAPFVFQGIGTAGDDDQRRTTRAALDRVAAAARPFDIGQAFGSFAIGQPDPSDIHTDTASARLAEIARACDPLGLLRFERVTAPR